MAAALAQGTPWGGLFAPWDEAKLAALYDRLLAEGQAEAARRFLARWPLAEWPQQPADALAAALYGWTAETLAEVAAWTLAQTLAAALPADADLAAWCARLVDEALESDRGGGPGLSAAGAGRHRGAGLGGRR